MTKYEFTGETKQFAGRTLHQIHRLAIKLAKKQLEG